MTIPIAPGVFDITPEPGNELWRASYLWNYVEGVIRKTAQEYGFQEIRTPLFERTELFMRGVGETTDIVSKEMYTFEDRGQRSMTLRPEGTAAVMRSFIENQMQQSPFCQKLFYIAPMFRYERTQAGRYRQHHQFGAEAIGNGSPEQDVELIDLLHTLYQRLGLKNLQVNINSIGDMESRLNYREALKGYLSTRFDQLSAESKIRFETNPLRILDSKDPKDKEINAGAPLILDFLSEASRAHFVKVQKLLDQLKISYKVNPMLVRGLDYYNNTVFEITAGELGAQNSVAGGGRFDGLLKDLGGPDLPSAGFGTGIERILQTLINQGVPLPSCPSPDIFMIAMGDQAKEACFTMLHELRLLGLAAQMDFSSKKIGKSMQVANQLGAKYTVVIGDNELQEGIVEVKHMLSGNSFKTPMKDLSQAIQKALLENHV